MRGGFNVPRWAYVSVVAFIFIAYEVRTSAVQSWVWSHYARQMTYTLGQGPSADIVFPKSGPFDLRRGYAQLPAFRQRLESAGFEITEQARFSPAMKKLAALGIPPPYREPAPVGLGILSSDGTVFYDASRSAQVYRDYGEIPPLLIQALLLMENRELADQEDARKNPVLEWDRLTRAGLTYFGRGIGLPIRLEGGSTLATQLEKFRHSPNGRTTSGMEKLRQMVRASLKAYGNGTDTRSKRQEIILDYINGFPLSAAPGFGEVHGLGEGLAAWFGLSLDEVSKEISASGSSPAKAGALKHALSLLAAIPAPSHYLIGDRASLEQRTNQYTRLLAEAGVLDRPLAAAVIHEPVVFSSFPPTGGKSPSARRKTINALRTQLTGLLGVPGFYELDRLHLDVRSGIDLDLENRVTRVFGDLKNPEFLHDQGLVQDRLLANGNPEEVVYSLLLFERTPEGNVIRVQTDSLDRYFDLNDGMKMELGSTAKLRTLAHYLEVIGLLHREYSALDPDRLRLLAAAAPDPLSRWTAARMSRSSGLDLSTLLEEALDRTYHASPYETFFTGGGIHRFENFDARENGLSLSVREATRRSTNLVFVRLMKDLVGYHEERLPYDSASVMGDPRSEVRQRLLEEIAEEEGRIFLRRAYGRIGGLMGDAIVSKLLGRKAGSQRKLAVLFYAWGIGEGREEHGALLSWLRRFVEADAADAAKLARAYNNPDLDLPDYAYLAGTHPLDLWAAGQLFTRPGARWEEILGRSGPARRKSSEWLFHPRNRRAQDLRLRIRIEADAFERMASHWQRLGFPFESLVPSLATALGASSDRPSALAALMGILVNDGVRREDIRVSELTLAQGTPYQSRFARRPLPGSRVMEPEVARALRAVLADVVEQGTGRRVAGAFERPDGARMTVGGKTGSGDNRIETFDRAGNVIASRVASRTACFVFYIEDRYYGVVTAIVEGKAAADYGFTSALPVAILKLLAPGINGKLHEPLTRPAALSQAGEPALLQGPAG